MKKTYSQKLLDPRWQRLRLLTFDRDNWKCVNCGNDKTQLHVHHEFYKGEPWDIPIDNLRTLCEKCHATIHFPRLIKQVPSVKKSTQYISPRDEKFKFVDSVILSLYNKINSSKYIIPHDELKSLKSELNTKLWNIGLVIVDNGVSYGLM